MNKKGLPCPFHPKVKGAPITCQEGYCDKCEIYRKVKEDKYGVHSK